jgi:hypothetical protein
MRWMFINNRLSLCLNFPKNSVAHGESKESAKLDVHMPSHKGSYGDHDDN